MITDENKQRIRAMTIPQLVKGFCDICIHREFDLLHGGVKGPKDCEQIAAEMLAEAKRREDIHVQALGALCHAKEMADISCYPSTISAYLKDVFAKSGKEGSL